MAVTRPTKAAMTSRADNAGRAPGKGVGEVHFLLGGDTHGEVAVVAALARNLICKRRHERLHGGSDRGQSSTQRRESRASHRGAIKGAYCSEALCRCAGRGHEVAGLRMRAARGILENATALFPNELEPPNGVDVAVHRHRDVPRDLDKSRSGRERAGIVVKLIEKITHCGAIILVGVSVPPPAIWGVHEEFEAHIAEARASEAGENLIHPDAARGRVRKERCMGFVDVLTHCLTVAA